MKPTEECLPDHTVEEVAAAQEENNDWLFANEIPGQSWFREDLFPDRVFD